MSNANIVVDNKAVIAMFNELDGRRRKQVFRATLNNSANILVKQTKQNLKRIKTKTGILNSKTLEKGVKKRTYKGFKNMEAMVHVMGDRRLRYFEMGTKGRKTKGHKLTGGYHTRREGGGARKYKNRKGAGGYRGKIIASHFFNSAKRTTERQIFNEMDNRLSDYTKKINAKYANK